MAAGSASPPADDAAVAVLRMQHPLAESEPPLAAASLLCRRRSGRICLLLQLVEAVPQRGGICISARRGRQCCSACAAHPSWWSLQSRLDTACITGERYAAAVRNQQLCDGPHRSSSTARCISERNRSPSLAKSATSAWRASRAPSPGPLDACTPHMETCQ